MIELAIYLPTRRVRYVVWLGRGGLHYGQTALASLVREELHLGKITYATKLWHWR